MSPLLNLAGINFFLGDVQGGLGPFLSTWLAEAGHWSPRRIGTASTIVGLSTLVLNGPAGALVDRLARPRLLLAIACTAILAGTVMLLQARLFFAVVAAQFLTAAGGTLVLPAMASLTLGVVGKSRFPRQQGRNQAFNHGGLLTAALLVGGTSLLGPGAAFWVLAAMAAAAIVAIAVMPGDAWNGRRAHGWKEEETEDVSHPVLSVLSNHRLLLLSLALMLFNLSNGTMLGLLGQKLSVAMHVNATFWLAAYVIVAQGTMIPIALWAGSLADRRGRRHLLFGAFAAQAVRAVISGVLANPYWLLPAEICDGVASGLLGVAIPVVVADLTWGSGRTQTALGSVNMVQGIGTALSGALGGFLAFYLGWTGAFTALAVPPLAAILVAFWLEETSESAKPKTGSKAASISARV